MWTLERRPIYSHPNHLAYTIFYKYLFHLSTRLGYQGRAIFFMQAMNAFVGALAVAVFARLMIEDFGTARGCFASLVLGFSAVFWTETIDPGCYALASLATIVLLLLFLRLPLFDAFVVGLLHGILVLAHQMLILAAPAFCFKLAGLTDIGKRKNVLAGLLPYACGLALVPGIAYVSIALRYHGGSCREALEWMFGPAGAPVGTGIIAPNWWSGAVFSNLMIFLDSLPRAVAAIPVLKSLYEFGMRILVGMGLASLMVWTLQGSKKSSRTARDIVPLWIWIGAMSAFQLFYNPGALRFRLLFLPALLWIGMQACREFKSRLLKYAVCGALALLICLNFIAAVKPRVTVSPDAPRVDWIREIVKPGDFLLFSGMDSGSVLKRVFGLFCSRSSRAIAFGISALWLGRKSLRRVGRADDDDPSRGRKIICRKRTSRSHSTKLDRTAAASFGRHSSAMVSSDDRRSSLQGPGRL